MDGLRIIRADLDDPEHQAAVLEMTRDYARDPMGNGCDLSDDVLEVLIPRLLKAGAQEALSKIGDLHVAARTSSFAFKGRNEDIRKIGEQLNVGTVLEGSVTRAGNRLRVTAQLINIADGYHLWSEDYDREMQDIFAIRSDVAQRVADALKVELGVGEQQRLKKQPTVNMEAYQLYLKGRYFESRLTLEGENKGVRYFRQAIALDPSYALAYNGLAYHYLLSSEWPLPPKEAMPKTREAAQKALELDDTLAEAHAYLAAVHWWYDWDWVAAEREFKRAIELQPTCAAAHELFGWFLVLLGRVDEGIAESRRAVEVDPLSPETNTLLGLNLYLARRYDEAITQLLRTLEKEPRYWYAHLNLARAYAQAGRVDEAIPELQAARQIEDVTETAGVLGWVYAVSGRREEAMHTLQALRERSTHEFVMPYAVALIYAGLRDSDHALEWLEKAYEEREFYLSWLKADAEIDTLRSDPRFAALLKKVGLEK